MKRQNFQASVLREQWDGDTRLYTRWDAAGVQVLQRVFTAAENTQADADTANAADDDDRVQVSDAVRIVAAGTGQFATAAARDAAIRALARAIVRLSR